MVGLNTNEKIERKQNKIKNGFEKSEEWHRKKNKMENIGEKQKQQTTTACELRDYAKNQFNRLIYGFT